MFKVGKTISSITFEPSFRTCKNDGNLKGRKPIFEPKNLLLWYSDERTSIVVRASSCVRRAETGTALAQYTILSVHVKW